MRAIVLCPRKKQRRAEVTVVAAGVPFNPDVPSRAA
jgi:hypothetical protein